MNKLYVIGDTHNFKTKEEAERFKKKLVNLGQDGIVTVGDSHYTVVVTGNYGPRHVDKSNYKRGIKGNLVKKETLSRKKATDLIDELRRKVK